MVTRPARLRLLFELQCGNLLAECAMIHSSFNYPIRVFLFEWLAQKNVLMLMDKKQFEFNNGTIKLGPCFFQLTVKDFREG